MMPPDELFFPLSQASTRWHLIRIVVDTFELKKITCIKNNSEMR